MRALLRHHFFNWGRARFGVARLSGPFYLPIHNAPVAQLDRASDYESEGRTFESFRVRHFL